MSDGGWVLSDSETCNEIFKSELNTTSKQSSEARIGEECLYFFAEILFCTREVGAWGDLVKKRVGVN